MGFQNFLREYFTFNRRERNGVFILMAIILVLIMYISFSDRFVSKEKIDFSKFEREISEFEAGLDRNSDSAFSETKNYFTSSNSPDADNAERFLFDPNNLAEEDWKRLGLSDKQISVIKKYESKGGKFRSKEDVKKMYCIQPELYTSLEAYIRIPNDATKNTPLSFSPSRSALAERGWGGAGGEVVEINSADTAELKMIRGIGTVFAKRIVKFREALGGFVKREQLLEVYGFDKEKFDQVASQITLDTSLVKKLNINTASVDDLNKHPYISKKEAVAIFTKRVKAGDYAEPQEIKKIALMHDTTFAKISPYLTIR